MKKLPRLTSRERLGYIIFILLIGTTVILLKLDRIFPSLNTPIPVTFDTTAYSRLQREIKTWENKYPQSKFSRKKSNMDTVILIYQYFDPNTADSITLRQLGLSPFVAGNILKYREKGGKFTSESALSRIYGMDSMVFTKIKSYIRIDSAYLPAKSAFLKRDSLPSIKHKELTVIDLNQADTAELKKIPGIGDGFSQQIVFYRQQLGGYVKLEQLKEIKYMTDSLFHQLKPWFKIDSPQVQQIAVNRYGIERMRKHPYLNFYQCKAIIELRKKKGKLSSIRELSLLEEFTKNDLQRLSYYLIFD